MARQVTFTYYPWIKQHISAVDLHKAVGEFIRVLQGALGSSLQIDLKPAMEIPDQLDHLKEKPKGDEVAKVAFLNPIGYALAHAEVPEVEGIAVIRRKIGTEIGPTYRAQLYTHYKKADKIKKLKDTRGFKIAYGSPQSTSNFLVPAMMLWEAGVHPLSGFERAVFAGGHDKAAIAVYKEELDVGAGHDGAIINLANDPRHPEFKDAKNKLIPIVMSDLIPSDPVAIHTSDNQVHKQIVDALLRTAKPNDQASEGNKAIKAFWDTDQGFDAIAPNAQITAESYVPLVRMMYPLGLRPKDMLFKAPPVT